MPKSAKKKKTRFAVMSVKELVETFARGDIGRVTQAELEEPTSESVFRILQSLCDFAYDTDTVRYRRSVADFCGEYAECYTEGCDMIATNYMVKQLCLINGINDFNADDIWNPEPQRLRHILSAIINFCRFREQMVVNSSDVREECEESERQREQMLQRRGELQDQLNRAQDLHDQEMPEFYEAEERELEVKAELDKRLKLKNVAEREIDEEEQKLTAKRERIAELNAKGQKTRAVISDLKSQIAQNPEGIELEINDFDQSIRQLKEKLGEQEERRRRKSERVQVYEKLVQKAEAYTKVLEGVPVSGELLSSARLRLRTLREELANLQRKLASDEASSGQLQHRETALLDDIQREERVTQERLQELEARRRQAMRQESDMQSRYTEDLQVVRQEEQELNDLRAAIKRAEQEHELDIAHIAGEKERLANQVDIFCRQAEDTLIECDAEAGVITRLSGGTAGCGALGMTPNPKPKVAHSERSVARSNIEARRLDYN